MRVAFLGPRGTYSHEAAENCFQGAVDYIEKQTITDVLDSLPQVDFGIVPQENTIFGTVTETYDALRCRDCFVAGEIVLEIQHCLVVRRGVKLESIDSIMSHEQALGQCRGFLAKNFPSASLHKTKSTAAAAETLSGSVSLSSAAAICSRLCASFLPDLEILFHGIQDENVNHTRFFVVSNSLDGTLNPSPKYALVRFSFQVPALNHPLNLGTLLNKLPANMIRIDRRPAIQSAPFHDVYFVELGQPSDDSSWPSLLRQAINNLNGAGSDATLMGMW